jgi:hypothetical protein
MSKKPYISQTDGLDFERQVLSLLKDTAISEGKIILSGNELPKSLIDIDAYAPAGILNFEGPCIIEIRTTLNTASIDKFEYLLHKYENRIQSAILIIQEIEQSRPRYIERLRKSFPNVNIEIYSKRDLTSITGVEIEETTVQHYFNQLLKYVSDIEAQVLENTPNVNKQHTSALITAYNEDKLALFIGAGLSKSVGLPDWPQLVRSVAARVFDKHTDSPLSTEEREEVQNFFEKEVPASPLIVARLLQNSLKEEFAESVREALYANITSTASSPLLEEIGALCMPRRDKTGIVGVVNYNFDDLLEIELTRRNIFHCSIMTEGNKLNSSDLPIYHVHGYLPRTIPLDNTHKESLVLSEDAYHTQFSDPFIWTNITQLNLLRNNVCLFIGISLTDPNHRRLLEITAKKTSSINHYAILTDHWRGQAAKKLSEKTQVLASAFKKLEEESYRNLGINVIWVGNHAEIPNLLAEIRGV